MSAPVSVRVCQHFAGVEDLRRRLRHGAAGADDVHVLMLPFARRGVVVVERERVRLGLLEEVDDLAILDGALGDADLVHRLLALRSIGHRRRAERRRPAAPVR